MGPWVPWKSKTNFKIYVVINSEYSPVIEYTLRTRTKMSRMKDCALYCEVPLNVPSCLMKDLNHEYGTEKKILNSAICFKCYLKMIWKQHCP